MIPVLSGARVWLATGVTDMRHGMNTLQVQLGRDPHTGDLFLFRGRKGDLVKVLWHDGLGMSLYAKRLEQGRFRLAPPRPDMAPVAGGKWTHRTGLAVVIRFRACLNLTIKKLQRALFGTRSECRRRLPVGTPARRAWGERD